MIIVYFKVDKYLGDRDRDNNGPILDGEIQVGQEKWTHINLLSILSYLSYLNVSIFHQESAHMP